MQNADKIVTFHAFVCLYCILYAYRRGMYTRQGEIIMCFYIGIKDIAANGLIELLKVDEDRRFLSYKKIESYGNEVVRRLNESGECAVLILSREDTSELFRNYSDFFEESRDSSGEMGIQLKEGKNVTDLIMQFRTYLALDVLLKFVDADIVRKAIL